MVVEIKSPTYPESVADGTIANWVKKEGQSVQQDELIAEIETDKIVLEVLSPINGKISKIIRAEGEIILSGELIAEIEESSKSDKENNEIINSEEEQSEQASDSTQNHGTAVRRMLNENNLDSRDIEGSGKGGRITKVDIKNHIENLNNKPTKSFPSKVILSEELSGRDEERVPMSRMRSTIAKRLLSVTQETAMLTTFNEVDMTPIKDLRKKYGTEFESEHGLKLGFMGFFVIASVNALKKFPVANASLEDNDVVYHGYQDISVAVSTDRGLVVPVIRDADMMGLPDIEKSILEYSNKAKEGKLSIDDMRGGTFTISNGGVFGSLLSTPILNAPQTAILGMHTIQDRVVVIDGKMAIRPMMYLALSYDHRLLDGKDAVSFLVSIKEQLESPQRLLLNL